MKKKYDLIIIGGGPAGLALAQCCSKIKDLKILIIDKENDVGGCHRVRRVYVDKFKENLFTEHGPRIISETYITFKKLLNEMGVNFYDLFTKYNFNITEIGGKTLFSVLSISELLSFLLPFLFLIFNSDYGVNINLYDFIQNARFSEESIEIINRICILTDGGDSTKFTLNEFLQLLNQQFFYSLYQPKIPNDIGLFKIWKEHLLKNNVDILLNTNIETINLNTDGNSIESIYINNEKIISKNFVFAIPPKSLAEIVNKNNINYIKNLNKYAIDTAYYDYISFTFHWDKVLNLKKVYGFPSSDWGIAFVKLTDYTTFKENNSKTVISIALTRSEKKSKRLNKTAHECTFEEIVNEVFLELRKLYGENFIYPSITLLSPGVIYNNTLKKWESNDTSFINSANYDALDFKGDFIHNMYNLGTHNGKSLYKFTSLESAVSNAIYLSKIIYPELIYDNLTIERSTTLAQVLFILLILCILILLKKNVY